MTMNTAMHAAFARAAAQTARPDADDDEDFGPNGNVDRDEAWRAPYAPPSRQHPARQPRSRYGRGFDAGTLATIHECKIALEEVAAEAAEVRRQLDAAAADPGAADLDWLGRARGALRGKLIIRDAIRDRLADLRGEPRPKARELPAPDLPGSAFPPDYDPAAVLVTSAACADACDVLQAEADALRALVIATGPAAARDWRLRVEIEIRRLCALGQRIQERRGALRREEKAQAAAALVKANGAAAWRKRFVRAAKETLPAETYAALCRAAATPDDAP
jgi:hypothetical protein